MARRVIGVGVDDSFFEEVKAAAEAEGIATTTLAQRILKQHFYPDKINETSNNTKSREERTMAETGYCPGCDEKKDKIRDLQAAAEKVETKYKTELEKAAAEATRLKADLAEAQKPKPDPEPVEDIFEHAAHCTGPDCPIKKKVDAHDLKIAGNVVTNLTKPAGLVKLKEIMAAAHVFEMPERITISGLPERR